MITSTLLVLLGLLAVAIGLYRLSFYFSPAGGARAALRFPLRVVMLVSLHSVRLVATALLVAVQWRARRRFRRRGDASQLYRVKRAGENLARLRALNFKL